MSAVPWPCMVAALSDMPDRWVCVPDGAEEFTGTGADEDEAIGEMLAHHEQATVH